MALRSFSDGRARMDTCRMVALSNAMVASMVGLASQPGRGIRKKQQRCAIMQPYPFLRLFFGKTLSGTVLQEASNRRALFEGLAGAEASNLAMVTWAPSRAQAASTAAEMMEAEDGESASMEVEQDRSGQQLPMPLWPQQQPHCMVQQQPIPVAWSL
ncbi:hypothetical protein TRIUR3_24569 [Triticum urartu]|uniref:Uncharacterized protein n=1 Tax=Triticum urartu TaxID=4572 RepID=M7ZW52_TRIUA|nr:hypothetical protein TRIUR3_24569 [Triticum urartu]